jgi:hypothetical protein
VARRLHHCRDLGESEPFDFLTWFEYSPSDEPGFNRLLAELRASVEWKYVDREIDIRLVHEPASIRFNCDLRAAYTCDTRSPAKPGKSSVSNNLGVTRHVCLSHQSLGKFSTYGLLFLSSISQGISCRLELAPCPAFEEGSPYTSGLHLVRYGRFPVVGQ